MFLTASFLTLLLALSITGSPVEVHNSPIISPLPGDWTSPMVLLISCNTIKLVWRPQGLPYACSVTWIAAFTPYMPTGTSVNTRQGVGETYGTGPFIVKRPRRAPKEWTFATILICTHEEIRCRVAEFKKLWLINQGVFQTDPTAWLVVSMGNAREDEIPSNSGTITWDLKIEAIVQLAEACIGTLPRHFLKGFAMKEFRSTSWITCCSACLGLHGRWQQLVQSERRPSQHAGVAGNWREHGVAMIAVANDITVFTDNVPM
ncbi:hypothetical protein BDR07DRAFT_1565726 [Suillus spraguei]|nr:hypothetical protein BDR07DRAFT_1565726 [Suillus spraguei]